MAAGARTSDRAADRALLDSPLMTSASLDPQWAPPAPPREPGTNGAALAALIFGVVGPCALFALLGIVLGIIALAQIRRSRQKGTGLAIAGIILGFVWIVAAVAAVVADLPLALSTDEV